MDYTTIAIIYNPKSTGSSAALARQLKRQIHKRLPRQKVKLIKTKHAGHSETLTYDIAKKSKLALVVSSSGDGGYGEVVNGAMRAKNSGHSVVTAVLPAGNANDHHRNLHTESLVDQIADGHVHKIDVLRLAVTSGRSTLHRYAHSYIGIGFTPQIAAELNRTKLNLWKEAWLVIRGLFDAKSVKLEIDGKVGRYRSLIFSNVETMSKYMKISSRSSVRDGKCEVSIIGKSSRLSFILHLLKTPFVVGQPTTSVDQFSFRTVRRTKVQLDGELMKLPAGSEVEVRVERQALTCLL